LEIFQGPKGWQHNENIRSGDVELDENALSMHYQKNYSRLLISQFRKDHRCPKQGFCRTVNLAKLALLA
jgi:hypothetical protein